MLGFIIRILSSVVGGGVISWITSNLAVLGIAAAIVAVTNLTTGTIWYIKGYNSAAGQCRVSTLHRRIDELTRDRDIQKTVAADASMQLEELRKREEQREKELAENADRYKPIDGCVVGPEPSRVRKPRP